MIDSLMENSHTVREQLLQKFGGVSGLFAKLEKMDRKRLAAKAPRKTTKRAASASKKRATPKKSKSR